MQETMIPAPPTNRRWLRRALAGLLVLAILIGSGWSLLLWRSNVTLQNVFAELDRNDPGWRLEDIEAKRKELSPQGNAALQALAASSLISRKKWFGGRQFDKVFDKLVPEAQFNL